MFSFNRILLHGLLVLLVITAQKTQPEASSWLTNYAYREGNTLPSVSSIFATLANDVGAYLSQKAADTSDCIVNKLEELKQQRLERAKQTERNVNLLNCLRSLENSFSLAAWRRTAGDESFTKLIEEGADQNNVSGPRCGWTALHYAVYFDDEGMVESLKKYGADENVVNNICTISPMQLRNQEEKEKVKKVVNLLSCLRSLEDHFTLAEWKRIANDESFRKLIAEVCASQNNVSGLRCGWTALHYAVYFGDKEMVNFLKRYGANENLVNNISGISPKQLAEQKREEWVEMQKTQSTQAQICDVLSRSRS